MKNYDTKAISHIIAEESGLFEWKNNYLKPLKDSDFVQRLGHNKSHNGQAFITPANKPDQPAIVIGGTKHNLSELASALHVDLESYNKNNKSKRTGQQKIKKHFDIIPLSNVDEQYFKYFKEHSILDPKVFLSQFKISFCKVNFEEYKNNYAFVLDLGEDNYKYFILDHNFNVVNKLNNPGSKATIFPEYEQDNKKDLFIVEGFADCLKLRQLGYNAFTSSIGVNTTPNLAKRLFKSEKRQVFICLDKDDASKEYIEKTRREFVKQGHKKVHVIDLPFDGDDKSFKDVCDYFKENSPSDFAKLVNTSSRVVKKLLPKKLEGVSGELQNIVEDLGYQFRKNLITGRIEVKNPLYGVDDYICLEEEDFSTIFTLCGQFGNYSKDRVDSLLSYLAKFNSEDPFKSYLESLSDQYEELEKGSEIFLLSETLLPKYDFDTKTDPDSRPKRGAIKCRIHEELKRWLVATVACMLGEDKNETVFVLKGGQGIGKTRWFERLLKNTPLESYFHSTRNLNPDNKDNSLWLATKAIINFDELSALSKGEVNALKSTISESKVSQRGAYKRYEATLHRHASFCGSTNDDTFLKDSTGNRRWCIIDVDGIEKNFDIDYNKLWAEAFHFYRSGYRYWLNEEETKARNEVNQDYQVENISEEYVISSIIRPEDANDTEILTTTEIAERIYKEKVEEGVRVLFNDMFVRGIGKVLAKSYRKCYKRVNGQSRRGWEVQFKLKAEKEPSTPNYSEALNQLK